MRQDQREEKRRVDGDCVYCRESKKTLGWLHSNVSTSTSSDHYSYAQYCIRAAQCTVVLKACFCVCLFLFVSKREDFVVIRAHFIKITDHLSIKSAQNTIMKHALILS